jgi:hypothetical protein
VIFKTRTALMLWAKVMLMAVTIAIVGCSTMSVSQLEDTYASEAPTNKVELTKEIQNKLKDRGFYTGTVDGISGPKTLSALAAYQKKNGLPSTNGINAKAYGQLSIWDITRDGERRKNVQQNKEEKQVAVRNSVRFISPEQTKTCKYVTQIVATSSLSHFGGIEQTEKWARDNLKDKAAKQGANGLRVADRLFDKGRGGYDKTRLTLYGDIYKCPQW